MHMRNTKSIFIERFSVSPDRLNVTIVFDDCVDYPDTTDMISELYDELVDEWFFQKCEDDYNSAHFLDIPFDMDILEIFEKEYL